MLSQPFAWRRTSSVGVVDIPQHELVKFLVVIVSEYADWCDGIFTAQEFSQSYQLVALNLGRDSNISPHFAVTVLLECRQFLVLNWRCRYRLRVCKSA